MLNTIQPIIEMSINMASAVANRSEFITTHCDHTYCIWYDLGAIPVITITSPTGAVLVEELASDKPEIIMRVLLSTVQ